MVDIERIVEMDYGYIPERGLEMRERVMGSGIVKDRWRESGYNVDEIEGLVDRQWV